MAQQSLEERVAVLEKTVADILARPAVPGRDDWQQTIGMFTNDEVMREIDDESLKVREESRRNSQSP